MTATLSRLTGWRAKTSDGKKDREQAVSVRDAFRAVIGKLAANIEPAKIAGCRRADLTLDDLIGQCKLSAADTDALRAGAEAYDLTDEQLCNEAIAWQQLERTEKKIADIEAHQAEWTAESARLAEEARGLDKRIREIEARRHELHYKAYPLGGLLRQRKELRHDHPALFADDPLAPWKPRPTGCKAGLAV